MPKGADMRQPENVIFGCHTLYHRGENGRQCRPWNVPATGRPLKETVELSHLKGITNISTQSNDITLGQLFAVLSGIIQALAVSVTRKEADV